MTAKPTSSDPIRTLHGVKVATKDGPNHPDATIEMYEHWSRVHTSRECAGSDPHIWLPNDQITQVSEGHP